MALFDNAEGQDPIFIRLASATEGPWYIANARVAAEELWRRTHDYLDTDLAQKASMHFHQCFWEMYLADVLLDLGLPLVPRVKREGGDLGPDLLVEPSIWIEAVTVSAGTGPDAVAADVPNQPRVVPDREIKLRLLSAFTEKSGIFERYRKNGVVRSNDACVVAINAASIPGVYLETTIPRIIRALLEVGDEMFVIDTSTGRVVERTHAHQPTVTKRSGSLVSQGMFFNGSHAHISACLYSAVDIMTQPVRHGRELILLHNPTASSPLPQGTIQRGREYWVDRGRLSCQAYDAV